MVDSMHPLPRPSGAQVVQIWAALVTHRRSTCSPAYHPAGLAGSGQRYFAARAGVVGSAESLQIMQADQFVKEALALFDKVTLALVGIGSVAPSKLLASSGNVFSTEELDMLREHSAVGDVCLRFSMPPASRW